MSSNSIKAKVTEVKRCFRFVGIAAAAVAVGWGTLPALAQAPATPAPVVVGPTSASAPPVADQVADGVAPAPPPELTPAPAPSSVTAPAPAPIPAQLLGMGTTGIDPDSLANLVPASAMVYAEFNLDRIRQWGDQMKDTAMRHRLDAAVAVATKSDARVSQLLSEISAFIPLGKRVGVALFEAPPPLAASANSSVPDGAPAAPMSSPQGGVFSSGVPYVNSILSCPGMKDVDVAVLISGVSTDQTNLLANLLGTMLKTMGTGMVWTEETEGTATIHVGTMALKSGEPGVVAWAVTGGVIIVTSRAETAHLIVRQTLNPEGSLGASQRLTRLASGIDHDAALWTYTDPRGSNLQRDMAQAFHVSESDLVGVNDLLKGWRGTVCSLVLKPDQIIVHGVQAYDPDSPAGTYLQTVKPTAMKAPGLSFGQSCLFMDAVDVPGSVAYINQLMQTVVHPLLRKLAGPIMRESDPAHERSAVMMAPIVDVFWVVEHDFLASIGNEVALSIAPPTNSKEIPSALLFLQKSDNPRLDIWMQDIRDTVQGATSMRWYPKRLMNNDLLVLGPATMDPRPTYAQIGDFHIWAQDLSAMKTPLFLSQGISSDHALAANQAFQRMSLALGPNPTMMVYADLEKVIQMLKTMSGGAIDLGGNDTSVAKLEAPICASTSDSCSPPPAIGYTAAPLLARAISGHGHGPDATGISSDIPSTPRVFEPDVAGKGTGADDSSSAMLSLGKFVVREFFADIRQLGVASFTDPVGSSDRLIISFDPNARLQF